MAEFASGLAVEAAKSAGKRITRQFSYLKDFTRNINNLKDEAVKLDDEIRGLQLRVKTATEAGQVILPAIMTWLRKSNDNKAEISGILSEAENVGSGCSKLGARFSLSKRAKKTTDRSKEHRGENKFDLISQPGPPAAAQTVPEEKTLDFESRKDIEEAIMTTLRGGVVNLIGIHGMGGLGKTTMAQRIRNRVLHENVFEEVAITAVSQKVETSKIQVEIGGQLGLDLKDVTSLDARLKLHARLSGTKRNLVILDDVWKPLKLKDLGIPCDSQGSRCTILMTSRNKDTLDQMSVQKIYEMDVLSEDEAWLLFGEKADISDQSDANLNSIAKQVMKECGGLPLALTAIGVTLTGEKDLSIWKDTLVRLTKVCENIPVYGPLKLSYDFLQSEEAKPLFLLCCLFKEDADISLEYLTYFCTGLSIFEGIHTLEEARNRMCSLVKMLINRSLLLESDNEGHVRMHDVVRDVCIFLAKQEGCIGGNNCTWVSSSQFVGERIELLTKSTFPNLRLLSLSPEEEEFEFDNVLFEGVKDLYVLCIDNYRKMTSLPHTTHSLINLKTLLLDSCWELKSISLVGKLRNLEILICHGCNSIEELPGEMKGLNRLKLLDVSWCRKLKSIGRGIISSLVALEELKMSRSFDKWEGEDREETENAGAQLTELEALLNLRCLEIEIKDPSLVMENMPHLSKKIVRFRIGNNSLGIHFKFSKGMSLCLKRETRLGDWIERQLLKDAEYLYLEGDGTNNVNLAKIQNIRWLQLRECESMKNVDATVFPCIEHLKLDSLPDLREICDAPILSASFQNLRELQFRDLSALMQIWKSSSVCQNNNVPHFSNLHSIDIEKCDSLLNLGQLSMAGKDCLPQLKYLFICECEMMEQVFLWNNEEAGQNKGIIKYPQIHQVITKVFPKLNVVLLRNLPNLKTFYQGIEGIEFPLLRKLEIEKCSKMKSIILKACNEKSNSGEITSSTADQDDIDDDDTLHLFCQSQKVSFGSSLVILRINHNPFCRHEIPSTLFNGLEKLTINRYVGSMSLFTLSVAASLVSLRELRITNCDEMIKMIEDEQQQQRIVLFSKLVELELKNLPKLVSFCEWKCDVEFPSLTQVKVVDCPDMENFSLGFVVAPNLKIICLNDVYSNDAKELNGALQQCLAEQEEDIRRVDEIWRRIMEEIRKREEEGGEEEQETKDDDHN